MVESGAGFVHEEDARLESDGAGDPDALLLTAGQTGGDFVQAVFDFVPKRGGFETALGGVHELVFVFHAGDAQAIDGVFEDGAREGIVLLEHHANLTAQGDGIDLRRVEIDVVDLDVTADDARAVHEVVDAIDGAQQGAFAAAGRPDEGGDVLTGDVQIEIEEHLVVTVGIVELFHSNEWMRGLRWSFGGQGGNVGSER